jgi:phage baseplate assembly protein gpV
MSVVDTLAADSEDVEADPKIYGVVVGRVVNVVDPLMLGRVQVQIPAIDAADQSPWARVAVPAAGMASGFYWLPNEEDEVLVAFEQGDLNAPYVIGCLWSAMAPPPLPSPLPQMRLIRTPQGNQIIITDAPPTITISTASGTQSILMTPDGIQVIAGTNIINMTPDGITITGTPNINLVASGQITLAAANVIITGTASTTVGSPASPCVIVGLPVTIN